MRTLRPTNYLLLASVCIVAIGAFCADCFAYPTPLQDPFATPIVCMKRLPDGAAVCVRRKTVVGLHDGILYVEEPDRSGGIRVVANGYYPPVELEPGNVVTFTGEMGTVDSVRAIYATSEFVCDLSQTARIGALGMSSPAIMGWPIIYKQPDGPRVTGLLPYGLMVRVWGRVTAKELSDDDGSWYVYLDDGWNKKDGTDPGYRGLRVYSDKIPQASEEFQIAVGVCTTKTHDPTPGGIEGDEFIVPVVRTASYLDLYYPPGPPVSRVFGSASGRVRLVGQAPPGLTVRVCTENESIILENVTDQWKPFTLSQIAADGFKVTAIAAGYLSDTRDIVMGQLDADLELTASDIWAEVGTNTNSIRSCSGDTALVRVLIRDCEGKGLPGRQVRLTVTMGTFVATGDKQILLTTDDRGFATTPISASPDGAGVSTVRAETYPVPSNSSQTDITITGPAISVSASVSYLTQPGTSTITGHLSENGLPLGGSSVTFRTDHGVFQESGTDLYQTNTDAGGDARALLVINGPGTARVVAMHSNECAHAAVGWTVVAYKSAPWYAQDAPESHPAIADLDNNPDGKKEVVLVTSSGSLVALNAQAEVVWSRDVHQGSNSVALAPMDADRSGLPCVFHAEASQQKVYAFTHDGRPLAGWPTGSNFRFVKIAPTIADVNRDGALEIVAGDECCYVFSWNPTGDWKGTGTADSSFLWRNLTGTPSTTIAGSTCAIGDIGSPAGILDVMVGTNHAPELYGFQGDLWGDFISTPVYIGGWPKLANGRVGSSPAVGDIDGDGKDDLAVGGDSGDVWIWLSSDGSWVGYPTGAPVRSSPALCDLDGDGKLDVVVGSDVGSVFAVNWLGHALPGWSGGIKLSSSGEYAVESSPVIGDVNGDGEVEVVVGCSDGNVYALYKDGTNHSDGGVLTGPIAWVRCCIPPGQNTAAIITSPAIDDVDNDGLVDVVVGCDKGVYLFHLNAAYAPDPSLYPWPTFHHDNARTGHAGPLPAPNKASIQGIVTNGGQPVLRAKVYVYYNDGATVYEPYSSPPVPRGFVYTVGTADITEVGRGAYCISQLDPNSTYKLKIVIDGQPDTWVTNIAVDMGTMRVDIDL